MRKQFCNCHLFFFHILIFVIFTFPTCLLFPFTPVEDYLQFQCYLRKSFNITLLNSSYGFSYMDAVSSEQFLHSLSQINFFVVHYWFRLLALHAFNHCISLVGFDERLSIVISFGWYWLPDLFSTSNKENTSALSNTCL